MVGNVSPPHFYERLEITVTKTNKKADFENFLNSDSSDNFYVANIYLVILLMVAINYILVELGLFYVPVILMRIVALTALIITGLVQILGRIPSLSSNKATKYIIIILTLVVTLTDMSALSFHAVLSLAIPLAISINYRSSGVSLITILGSALCALLSPVLGLIFKTWNPDFFKFLLWCSTGGTIGEPEFTNTAFQLGPIKSAIFFIGLPQLGYAVIFGIAIYFSSRRKRKIFEGQIRTLKSSRNSMIEGMANIVENRDITTGGHVRRTSDVVKLLIGNLKKDEAYKNLLNRAYCEKIVMAASLHDLGKIAIPDAILNKPAKLTDEEFEYIKIHPQKGCNMVHSIMQGIHDDELMKIAENISLFHHEKYDGCGYPTGLRADGIPLEARIMAIADVYDALVSERCYKEPMSHEDAYDEILRSMGSHFDPSLKECFIKSYPQIVKYYNES